MGRNNRQRRAAKAKDRRRRAHAASQPSAGEHGAGEHGAGEHGAGEHGTNGAASPDDAFDGDFHAPPDDYDAALKLLTALVQASAGRSRDHMRYLVEYLLRDHDAAIRARAGQLVAAELTARVGAAWERGWQPRDIAHVAARKPANAAVVAASAITVEAQFSGAMTRAPQDWRDQLAGLAEQAQLTAAGSWQPITALQSRGADEAQAWVDVLVVAAILAELPVVEPLSPPPSRWGRTTPTAAPTGSPSRDRMLNKIRGLLAKAEATDHPAEAETFTAKAQELMTRYAVDEALLRDGSAQAVPVTTIRIHLQSPYAGTKVMLLHAVSRANRARSIYFDNYDIASVIGTPAVVDQVEMLFTSLLIQATRSMTATGKTRPGSADRSVTFRRSFLTAYASRIGERLTEADRSTTDTYGAELVPVLQREADAVDAEFARQFPHTTTSHTGRLDPRGWEAGRAAADEAVFTAGRLAT